MDIRIAQCAREIEQGADLVSRKTENCLTSGCCSLSRTLDSDFAIFPPRDFILT